MRTLWISILLSSWTAVGCMTSPKTVAKTSKPAPAVARSAEPRSNLTADKVNENNAREVATALHQELEQENRRVITPTFFKNAGPASTCKD